MKRVKERLTLFPYAIGLAGLIWLISSQCQAQKLEGTSILLVEIVYDSLSMNQPTIRQITKDWAGKVFGNPRAIKSDTELSMVLNYDVKSSDAGAIYKPYNETMVIDYKESRVRVRVWLNGSGVITAQSTFYNNKGEVRDSKKQSLSTFKSDAERFVNKYRNYLKQETKEQQW
jgi:hypothetical protein